MPEEPTKPTAPYLPYPTLTTFFESLRQHPLPQVIDNSVMTKQSGTGRSQITTCLKFMSLLDANSRPLEPFKALFAATDEAAWVAAFKPIVVEAYKALETPDLNTVTVAQLEALFRSKYANTGETFEKGLRFYLKCIEIVGIPFSKRLTERTARPATKRTPKVDKVIPPAAPAPPISPARQDAVPKLGDLEIHKIKLGDLTAEIHLPSGMDAAQIQLFGKKAKSLVTYLTEQLDDTPAPATGIKETSSG